MLVAICTNCDRALHNSDIIHEPSGQMNLDGQPMTEHLSHCCEAPVEETDDEPDDAD